MGKILKLWARKACECCIWSLVGHCDGKAERNEDCGGLALIGSKGEQRQLGRELVLVQVTEINHAKKNQ